MAECQGVTEAEAERIAELQVRRYFDSYLTEVLPVQMKQVINAHNADREAHGGVERKFNRMVYMAMGACLVGGGSAGAFLHALVGL